MKCKILKHRKSWQEYFAAWPSYHHRQKCEKNLTFYSVRKWESNLNWAFVNCSFIKQTLHGLCSWYIILMCHQKQFESIQTSFYCVVILQATWDFLSECLVTFSLSYCYTIMSSLSNLYLPRNIIKFMFMCTFRWAFNIFLEFLTCGNENQQQPSRRPVIIVNIFPANSQLFGWNGRNLAKL